MRDHRFYFTPGSRWRFTSGFFEGQYLSYYTGTEFSVVSYVESMHKVAIRCEEPRNYKMFSSTTEAVRYESHPLVTGTLPYKKIARKIEMIEPARGRIYFSRVGGSRFYTGDERYYSTGYDGEAKVWTRESQAWRGIIMDAWAILRRFNPDNVTLHAFDPMTEQEYELVLPEWKMRMLRWLGKEVAGRVSKQQTEEIVNMLIKAEAPFTVAEAPTWQIASEIRSRLSGRPKTAASYLIFQKEEDAVLAKMTASANLNLFVI